MVWFTSTLPTRTFATTRLYDVPTGSTVIDLCRTRDSRVRLAVSLPGRPFSGVQTFAKRIHSPSLVLSGHIQLCAPCAVPPFFSICRRCWRPAIPVDTKLWQHSHEWRATTASRNGPSGWLPFVWQHRSGFMIRRTSHGETQEPSPTIRSSA